MRRRTVLAAAAVAAVAIGVAGCGIPDETQVRDIGAGPAPGFATGGTPGQGPPSRDNATTKEGFVTDFLAAVAGDPKKTKPTDRIRRYVTESAQDQVKEREDAVINVVRRQGEPVFAKQKDGTWRVTLKVDQIGVLSEVGSVDPAVLPAGQHTYTFYIGGTEGKTDWFVTKPPQDLLLSTEALRDYYLQRTIYFWNKDRTALVPDNRYMPSELEEGQQPTEIVRWLTTGPSAWIKQSVSPLNLGSQGNQNVPYPSERLEVGLNAEAAEQPMPAMKDVDVLDQLGKQLMWSLRPYLSAGLELRVEGQGPRTFEPDAAFFAVNPAHRRSNAPGQEAVPQRFALYQGKIYRLKGSAGGGTDPLPQLLLEQGVNEGLDSATLAQETGDDGVQTAAALVSRQGQQFRLRVGDGTNPFTKSGPYAEMSRPVLLKMPMDAGLVVINKRLYRFTLDGGVLEQVPVAKLDGTITDVAAAPDGRRIALVAGGKVYVAGLARGRQIELASEARVVPTRVRDATAVDWGEETWLVVAGTVDLKPAVWHVTADGAIENQHTEDAGGRINHLVAYPVDPVVGGPAQALMFDRGGAAFDQAGGDKQVEAGEVVGAPGEFDPADVTAPFFLMD
ncbi:LpqB family beta-propeller domain-containing protein [Phytohabitans sp. LJ34]|uniref:LpqB family beta-propeller domain-containing protein n=1 Tax=Phytohabitans sp. LJ34 TaxID=3452217 RepID=UPI003F8BD4BD